NNHELEADAIEIRMRATRRMDQMRQEQAKTIGLAKGGGGKHGRKRVAEKPTLKDAGINKNLAHEGRKLGALSDQEFEQKVTEARADAISLAEVAERAAKRQQPPKGEAKKHHALTSDDLHRAAAEDFPRWLADIARHFRGHPPSPEMIAEVLPPKQRETILEDAQAIIEFLNEVKRALWEAGKPRPCTDERKRRRNEALKDTKMMINTKTEWRQRAAMTGAALCGHVCDVLALPLSGGQTTAALLSRVNGTEPKHLLAAALTVAREQYAQRVCELARGPVAEDKEKTKASQEFW